jgi:hypothetical protein
MDLWTISPIRYWRQEAPQEAQLGGQSLVTDYQSLFGEQTRKRSTTLCRGTFRFLSVRTLSDSLPLGLRSSSLRSFGATGNHLCLRNSPQRLRWEMLINTVVHSWNLSCLRKVKQYVELVRTKSRGFETPPLKPAALLTPRASLLALRDTPSTNQILHHTALCR